jgi:hypothetical protein
MIARYYTLAQRIQQEMEEIALIVETTRRHWQKEQAATDPDVKAAFRNSAALNMHGFYAGLERIFELIATEIDDHSPRGEIWHRESLRQMALEMGELRPVVLRPETAVQLDEYRRFRHLVRNNYTTHLDEDRLAPLAEDITTVWSSVRDDLENFIAFLDTLAKSG